MVSDASRVVLELPGTSRDDGDDEAPSPVLRTASVPHPLVVELREAVAEHPRLEEAQRPLVAELAEEKLAVAEHDRVHRQSHLVDEVVLQQRVDERTACEDDELALELPLQPRDLAYDVALQYRRVAPDRIDELG